MGYQKTQLFQRCERAPRPVALAAFSSVRLCSGNLHERAPPPLRRGAWGDQGAIKTPPNQPPSRQPALAGLSPSTAAVAASTIATLAGCRALRVGHLCISTFASVGGAEDHRADGEPIGRRLRKHAPLAIEPLGACYRVSRLDNGESFPVDSAEIHYRVIALPAVSVNILDHAENPNREIDTMQTLQSQVVVSATDKTGDAFASIDARLKNFARTAKGVSQDFSGFAKGAAGFGGLGATPMPAVAGRLGATAGQRFSAGFTQGTSGIAGAFGSAAAAGAAGFAVGGPIGAAGAVAGTVIFHVAEAVVNIAKEAVKTGADLKHEEIRWGLAGGDPKDFVALNKKAEQVSKATGLQQVEVLQDIIDMYSTVAGNIEAIHNSIQRVEELKVVAINRDPKNEESIREQFTQVLKSAELRGVTLKPAEFDGVDRRTMPRCIECVRAQKMPSCSHADFFQGLKYARAEGLKMDRESLTRDMPILSQELGATSAGQAMSAFGRQFASGHVDHKQALAMIKYGLVKRMTRSCSIT